MYREGFRLLITLGITDAMRPQPVFEKYLRWLTSGGTELQIVKLSYVLGNTSDLDRCHGVILTGGGDVHPKYYNRPDAIAQVEEVNEQRDDFEFGVIDEAMRRNLPVLGICRGMQIFNVSMGGSLFVDVGVAGFTNHRDGENDKHRHRIVVDEGSRLQRITGALAGTVNSIHHQGIDRIGRGLRISARSDDGLPEAMEWEDPTRKQFLLLVQWHPERMTESGNPFSSHLRESFIERVERTIGDRTAIS